MPTVRRRGNRWQAIVRVKRDGATIYTESRTFSSERLATDWGTRLEATVRLNGVPHRQLTTTTLGDLLGRYTQALETYGKVRRTRIAELDQIASDKLLTRTKLSDLQAATFVAFASRRREAGAGPATVLHNLATLRGALNAAKAMFGLDVSGASVAEAIAAMSRVGAVSTSERRERRPSTEELQALAEEFNRVGFHPSTVLPMAAIVELAVALPRRLGELTDMKWVDVNKDRRLVTLRDTKHPTTPRTETIPLPPAAARIIEGLPVIDERVLPYKPESIGAAFRRACTRLGIEDLHFHDLRHEGITRLFERGLAIQEVALISGHQSWAMLRRYTHPSAMALSEKLNASEPQAPQAGTQSQGA